MQLYLKNWNKHIAVRIITGYTKDVIWKKNTWYKNENQNAFHFKGKLLYAKSRHGIFFSLRFQAFLLHVVQIPINLPTRENIPRLCRVVRNSIQEKGQQFKNQITTFTTLWSEYKASWQYRIYMYTCIFHKYRTLIKHVTIQVASWLSWIDDMS